MALLFYGPPASGKSKAALDRFRSIPGSHLIVPTATMAEHLRHELARSGFPLRPSRVGTLAQWLDSCEIPKSPPEALLHYLIAGALDRLKPVRFAPLLSSTGFHAALCGLLNELPEGAFPALPEDLAAIFRVVQENLAERGFAPRQQRLRAAAVHIRAGASAPPPHIVLDGFFTFSSAELDLMEALASRTSVTLTLPEFSGAEMARKRLEAAGFALERFSQSRRAPHRVLFSAPSPEREAEEIARRILEHAARGRRFREIGIVLRARDPHEPLIETTLARFGIPARPYFADPLAAHPVIAYLSGAINALLKGWGHSDLVALLRMPVSGLGATPAGDRLDFAIRETLPGHGLPIPSHDREGAVLDKLSSLDPLRHLKIDPTDWADRLKPLRDLLPRPMPGQYSDREQIGAWRSTAAALDALDRVLDQTAESLAGLGQIGLSQFWKQAETALALEPLRIEDRRRDVVHILDVFEARQWELPMVFVCGLLERDFPQYHREDPIIGDALRRRLDLSTAAQRQQEERFLFELAVTRATEEVVLSYARFDEKGAENLPSFFLDGAAAEPCEIRIRPKPSRMVPPPSQGPIQDHALRAQIEQMHKTLSPTSIESFLQCPFQFFAGKTLRLRTRPPAPQDRLDLLIQGAIIHRALAEWIAERSTGSAIFNRVFDEECQRGRVPRNYRAEAVRLELLRSFERFIENRELELPWLTRTEEKFEFPLNGLVTIHGRIDRLETGPNQEVLVIDYKNSAANKIRERVQQSEAGHLVQGGLYLLAAEKALGLKPAGMLFCGLKKEVSWGGWHVPIGGMERVGESRTREALRELMDQAAGKAAEAFEAISSGRIAAAPADSKKCGWCDYRDICRIESAALEREAGAA